MVSAGHKTVIVRTFSLPKHVVTPWWGKLPVGAFIANPAGQRHWESIDFKERKSKPFAAEFALRFNAPFIAQVLSSAANLAPGPIAEPCKHSGGVLKIDSEDVRTP